MRQVKIGWVGVFLLVINVMFLSYATANEIENEGIKGVAYSKDGKVKFQSKKAKFKDGRIEMKNNVKIETERGLSLDTDFLVWDKKKDLIHTNNTVNLKKDKDLEITGKGFEASTVLKKASLEKNVVVTIKEDKKRRDYVMVTCDGPLEIDYEKGRAIFYNNVKVNQKESQLFSDKATMYFDAKDKKLIKIVAEGNVRIIRGENTSFSQKATYFAQTKRVVLEGSPRLVVFPKESKLPVR